MRQYKPKKRLKKLLCFYFNRTWSKQYGLPIAHDKSNIVYRANTGEFMWWLAFTWGLSSVWKFVIMKYILVYALVLTNRKYNKGNAFFSCFWRTSLLYPTQCLCKLQFKIIVKIPLW